ncbi:MAG: SpoIIE family protein phosphatase [Deltaproteobacteria bacterium]|nr:SpoIIE family protein phosphatase [Deltaproteobacteria bacterium]
MASIRKKITLSFLAVILIPLIVATFFSAYFLLNKVEQEALNNVRQDVKVASLIYLNKLTGLKSFCQLTSKDNGIIMALQYHMTEKLTEYMSQLMERGDFSQITVTDAGGKVVADVPGWEKAGTDLKHDPFIQKAMIGSHPAASEKTENAEDAERRETLSLTSANPVFDRDGFTQIGVLRVRYHIEKDLKMLNRISGAIMGGVDLFLGTRRVASAAVDQDKRLVRKRELSPEMIEKTLNENKAHVDVRITKNGYLAEFKPITDLNYRPIGVMAIYTASDEYYYLRLKSARSLLFIAICALILGFLIGQWLKVGITRPIIQLTERTTAVARGDFSRGPLEIKSRDEIGTLSTAFNKMTQDLLLYIDNLQKTTAERERMAKELEIGHQIQQNFLPDKFPQLDRAHIYGQSIPAREVGGDFFDVFMLDQNRVGLVIADVSGKGVPAALFMALCRSVVRITALSGHDPGETLEYVNRFISEDNEECMFVTTFYGILDIRTGELVYANGGHNYPIIYRYGNGDIETLQGAKGMALGIAEDFHFPTAHESLDDGDILLLYTDGIVEAHDPDMQEYGLERLSEILANHTQISPEDLGKQITRDVEGFSNGLPQFDDITFLVVKIRK